MVKLFPKDLFMHFHHHSHWINDMAHNGMPSFIKTCLILNGKPLITIAIAIMGIPIGFRTMGLVMKTIWRAHQTFIITLMRQWSKQ